VFANLLAVKVVTRLRFDLTKRELYTLSQGTRRTLGRLTDTVTITVYWTPTSPRPPTTTSACCASSSTSTSPPATAA
jgi:ABC-type uncharacterized transport system involved in gliding motility auxiliary subunit